MDNRKQILGALVLASWLGFGLVVAIALAIGDGFPVVLMVGAMALASTFAYTTARLGPKASDS